MSEAIESLLKAKSIVPDSVDIKVTLGDMYFSAGHLEDAKKLFDDAYLSVRCSILCLSYSIQ